MFLKEFKDLRRKRGRLLGLPDQLNYAIQIDDYTIAMKDGAFLSAFECSGLDLNSASVEELDAHRAQAVACAARLDDGFMYNVDLIRRQSVDLPEPHIYRSGQGCDARSRAGNPILPTGGPALRGEMHSAITYRPPADVRKRGSPVSF